MRSSTTCRGSSPRSSSAITLSSLALGAVGEPASRDLGRRSGLPGASRERGLDHLGDHRVRHLELLTLVLGEIVPKTFTLQHAERVALLAAGPCGCSTLLPPVHLGADGLAVRRRASSACPSPGYWLAHSEEELKSLVAASGGGQARGGGAGDGEQGLRVLRHRGGRGDGAAPRRRRPARDADDRGGDEEVLEHPYTRYPVYREDLDDILGLLHIRACCGAAQRRQRPSTTIDLLRPAYIVPETKPLASCSPSSAARNAHGDRGRRVRLGRGPRHARGPAGGDRRRDRRRVRPARRRDPAVAEDRVRVGGSFPIDEFNERFGCDLSDEDYNTVGGYVFGELGRAPQEGDTVGYDGARSRSSPPTGRASSRSTSRSRRPRRRPARTRVRTQATASPRARRSSGPSSRRRR